MSTFYDFWVCNKGVDYNYLGEAFEELIQYCTKREQSEAQTMSTEQVPVVQDHVFSVAKKDNPSAPEDSNLPSRLNASADTSAPADQPQDQPTDQLQDQLTPQPQDP